MTQVRSRDACNAVGLPRVAGLRLHPEIKHKKTHLQYDLREECLSTDVALASVFLDARYVMPGTAISYRSLSKSFTPMRCLGLPPFEAVLALWRDAWIAYDGTDTGTRRPILPILAVLLFDPLTPKDTQL
eukprot:1591245-Rhodomonas_salina.1